MQMKLALFSRSSSPRNSGGGASISSPRASTGGSATTAMPPLTTRPQSSTSSSVHLLTRLTSKPTQAPMKNNNKPLAPQPKALLSTTARQSAAAAPNLSPPPASPRAKPQFSPIASPTVPRFSKSIIAATSGHTNSLLLSEAKEILGLGGPASAASPRMARHSADGNKSTGQMMRWGSSNALTADPPKIKSTSIFVNEERSSAPSVM